MPRDFVDCDCYNLDKSLLNENVRFHRKSETVTVKDKSTKVARLTQNVRKAKPRHH